MINNDRIVPITAIDLISMYSLVLDLKFTSGLSANMTKLNPTTDERIIADKQAMGYMVSEPVKGFDVKASAAALHYYFVPAYDYEGVFYNGEKITPTGDIVEADGRSLYFFSISGGDEKTFTIKKFGY